jgi:hypothetical protein
MSQLISSMSETCGLGMLQIKSNVMQVAEVYVIGISEMPTPC